MPNRRLSLRESTRPMCVTRPPSILPHIVFGVGLAGERRNFANEGRIRTSITQAGMHSFCDGSPRRGLISFRPTYQSKALGSASLSGRKCDECRNHKVNAL